MRTIELYVHYDPAILTSTGGRHGQLFSNAGAFIFEDWEEIAPGYWHGYAIVMDAYHWATGPGELYVWTFTADVGGLSPITVDSVTLYAPDASRIPDVVLPPTTVRVFDPASTGVATPRSGPVPLTLSPNPFNPRTVLTFTATVEGAARIEVYDCRGGNVATAWSGWSNGQPLRVPWDARSRDGSPLASGVYLFRLEGPHGVAGTTRGVLLK